MKKKIPGLDIQIALIYWVIGMVWIYASDRFFSIFTNDSVVLTKIQHYKGWLFVTVSAIIIDVLIRRYGKILQSSQRQLIENEERLRLALRTTRQGVVDIDLQTNEIIFNDFYLEILGYQSIPEKNLEFLKNSIEPQDLEKTYEEVRKVIRRRDSELNLEFRQRSDSGEWLWISFVGQFIEWSKDGKPLRILGMVSDISKEKEKERKKVLFDRIFEESLNEIYLFDAVTYKFKLVNKAAIYNLGYSLGELLDMTPLNLKPEMTLQEFTNLISPLFEGEVIQINLETVHQRKNGSRYDVEVHLQLLNVEGENLISAIVLDISERKAAEKRLREERQRLAGIIAGTNVGTWESNYETRESIVNERWAEIIGYTVAELEPFTVDNWKERINPDDLPRVQEHLAKHYSGEAFFYEVEYRIKHKDGHWVWVQDRGRTSEWAKDGSPLKMQGTYQDISQRKKNEAKYLEQLEELQRWYQITLGREERIIELKKEVNELLEFDGNLPRYEFEMK